MIELQQVSYSYENHKALDCVSFQIREGEAVALLGPNGCGKSTLMKLINGLVFPESGKYLYRGTELTAKKMKDPAFSKDLHRKIGFVFQNSDVQLFCSRVYDEIAFGPRQLGMTEDEVSFRVHNCLTMFGIEELAERIPFHLSGGEKKKVAIASILVLDPEILILDEPTNGLDPKTQRWMVEMLDAQNAAGKTLITSSHNLELVQEISNRAILFDEQHRIAADLPTTFLLEKTELLARVNLVDQDYHCHYGSSHKHFHMHGLAKRVFDTHELG